jgi:tight adherence protein C
MTMLLVLAMVMLAAAVYLMAQVSTHAARQQQLTIRRAAGYGRTRAAGTALERLNFRDRVLTPGIRRLAEVTLRLSPKASVEGIGTRLIASGLAGRISTTQFLAIKGGMALGGLVLALVVSITALPVAVFFLAPLFAVLGFVFPNIFVTFATRSRRERILRELPDALDLLAVSVEAGLGFDGAVTKLTEHMDGALVDEFSLTLGEIRIGKSRSEALKGMAARVPVPEVGAFVRAVTQAEQMGISLGRILRVQAADSRNRRQAAAEEKAMKAPIKMLFPTVIFIFPAMFIVILGPALLNLMDVLG